MRYPTNLLQYWLGNAKIQGGKAKPVMNLENDIKIQLQV